MIEDELVLLLHQGLLLSETAEAGHLMARLRQCTRDENIVDAYVGVAPVYIGAKSRRFHLDADSCTWAILAPCMDEAGNPSDIAAFPESDFSNPATLKGYGFAIGLEAIFDARLDQLGRVSIHADLWGWARAKCRGLLPIDWRRTAIHILERRVDALLVNDVAAGRVVRRELGNFIKVPTIYVGDQEAIAT